jgi:hypothetical protein
VSDAINNLFDGEDDESQNIPYASGGPESKK